MNALRIHLFTLATGLLLGATAHAATTPVKLSDLATPSCAPAEFDSANGQCKAPANLATVKKEDCPKAPGFSVVGDKCSFDPAQAKPQCDTTLALTYNAELKQCVLVKVTPTSAPGSYVGDCFQIKSAPSGSALQADHVYLTTEQHREGENDRKLSLVEGKLSLLPVPGIFGCRAASGGPKHEALASNLVAHGARRYGWAFGALTMPYKYYRKTKEFQVGVPIGAYLGYRMGQAGAGYTFAGAFTMSQVKADTIDPNVLDAQGKPTVTGSTDVAAMSWALGMVFDLSKEPGTKPFKAGLFVGQDRVNRAPNIDYKNNGRTWIALQVGYDFTDN